MAESTAAAATAATATRRKVLPPGITHIEMIDLKEVVSNVQGRLKPDPRFGLVATTGGLAKLIGLNEEFEGTLQKKIKEALVLTRAVLANPARMEDLTHQLELVNDVDTRFWDIVYHCNMEVVRGLKNNMSGDSYFQGLQTILGLGPDSPVENWKQFTSMAAILRAVKAYKNDPNADQSLLKQLLHMNKGDYKYLLPFKVTNLAVAIAHLVICILRKLETLAKAETLQEAGDEVGAAAARADGSRLVQASTDANEIFNMLEKLSVGSDLDLYEECLKAPKPRKAAKDPKASAEKTTKRLTIVDPYTLLKELRRLATQALEDPAVPDAGTMTFLKLFVGFKRPQDVLVHMASLAGLTGGKNTDEVMAGILAASQSVVDLTKDDQQSNKRKNEEDNDKSPKRAKAAEEEGIAKAQASQAVAKAKAALTRAKDAHSEALQNNNEAKEAYNAAKEAAKAAKAAYKAAKGKDVKDAGKQVVQAAAEKVKEAKTTAEAAEAAVAEASAAAEAAEAAVAEAESILAELEGDSMEEHSGNREKE